MSYSVLIVDDEMLIREGLRKHINWEMLGMHVGAVADSAQNALKAVQQEAPDILITDICMRGKSGLDLVEDLLEMGISIPVILISSYNEFSYAQRAVRLNVVREYILKPIDTDALTLLLQKLREELDSRATRERLPVLMGNVTVTDYHSFLKAVRAAGYDRIQFLSHIKKGDAENALRMWDCVQKVIQEVPQSYAAAKRFCSSLLVAFVTEGLFLKEESALDPVLPLNECRDCREICEHMRRTTLALCREQSEHTSKASTKLIASGLEIIDRRCCEPDFNLTALAAELAVTPNYLSIRFKEEIGVGFAKYVLTLQMEKAKQLLADPYYKIYQVSELVGFQDEKYFSRQFKKFVGVTPKEYRNEHTSPL